MRPQPGEPRPGPRAQRGRAPCPDLCRPPRDARRRRARRRRDLHAPHPALPADHGQPGQGLPRAHREADGLHRRPRPPGDPPGPGDGARPDGLLPAAPGAGVPLRAQPDPGRRPGRGAVRLRPSGPGLVPRPAGPVAPGPGPVGRRPAQRLGQPPPRRRSLDDRVGRRGGAGVDGQLRHRGRHQLGHDHPVPGRGPGHPVRGRQRPHRRHLGGHHHLGLEGGRVHPQRQAHLEAGRPRRRLGAHRPAGGGVPGPQLPRRHPRPRRGAGAARVRPAGDRADRGGLGVGAHRRAGEGRRTPTEEGGTA